MVDLSRMPNFCSHEHWGSIDSIGAANGGFRADMERGAVASHDTGLMDIVLDPYFRGWLVSGGEDLDGWASEANAKNFHDWAHERPSEAYEALRPALEHQVFTGAFQCIRRGLIELYDVDIMRTSTTAWLALDKAIYRNYSNMFTWYLEAMKQASLSGLIRPVHPEYYLHDADSETARQEGSFTRSVLRIDPLLGFWKAQSPRRDALEESLGVVPRDAASWRRFIGALFELAASKGAVGIKQLQAYVRPIEYLAVKDEEVTWSGELSAQSIRVFQDWVMHECCRQAHERGWAHQVHTGTHNLTQSSPMPLTALASRYPRQKLVLLHCWPYTREAGWMAKHHPNVYIDTCWMAILNPVFLRDALRAWMNYVPLNKIMMGHDGTSVEMAVGSSLFVREILTEILDGQSRSLGLTEDDLLHAASSFLNDNAVDVYGVGERVRRSA
jgi:predicted TIM-barrel fold metal-dependent hydrolase